MVYFDLSTYFSTKYAESFRNRAKSSVNSLEELILVQQFIRKGSTNLVAAATAQNQHLLTSYVSKRYEDRNLRMSQVAVFLQRTGGIYDNRYNWTNMIVNKSDGTKFLIEGIRAVQARIASRASFLEMSVETFDESF